MHFIGEYEVKVDDKGRVMVPVALRKQLPPDMQDRFVLHRGFENCVAMSPYAVFMKEAERIAKMNDKKKSVREYQRFFVDGAVEITLDSNGRMLIPKHLKEWAGLGREIVIATRLKKIEIWSKEKKKTPTAEDGDKFSDMAEDLFGDEDEDGDN
ncbi:MAG: division/cell wall cluster transcriptional repressor MraZ [Bacteroidetes bacterium]|nr:division/cell wall cluster transcriptional repressor MraZ [Bacteroidota bacterium]